MGPRGKKDLELNSLLTELAFGPKDEKSIVALLGGGLESRRVALETNYFRDHVKE